MRLIFVNRYFFPDHSATSQVLSDLAFGLVQTDRQVHVVTSRLVYDDPKAQLPSEEDIRGISVHRVWTFRFGRKRLAGRFLDYLSFYPAAFLAVLKLLRREDLVVAMTDPPLLSIPVSLAAKLRQAVTINWLQDVFPEVASALGWRSLRGPLGILLRWARDWTLRAAYSNVVLGQRMAEVVRLRRIDDRQIEVIPNWADGKAIRPLRPEVNLLRSQWGFGGKFIAGYSGNLGRGHEFETMLGAAELLRNDPRIAFLVIGGGHGYERMRTEVERRGLRNVFFKPYQPREQLALTLTLPDVHLVSLLPRLEGLIVPSKFYGAAAAGRPVAFIGSITGELANEIALSRGGVAIEPKDSAGLATFLVHLRGNPILKDEMGERIRAIFDRRYDKTHALDKWKNLIRAAEASRQAN